MDYLEKDNCSSAYLDRAHDMGVKKFLDSEESDSGMFNLNERCLEYGKKGFSYLDDKDNKILFSKQMFNALQSRFELLHEQSK